MSSPGSRRPPARGQRPAGRGTTRRTAAGSRPRATATTTSTRPTRSAKPTTTDRPPPRLTSRAAVLVLIVAVLAVSYASSLRAYLQQRDHLDDVQQRIDASQAAIDRLEREKERLDDPAYLEQRAREQGYVKPGEKPFVVLEDGKPLDVPATLSDPVADDPAEPEAWFDDFWSTMEVAGNPPRRTDPRPATKIGGGRR